MAEASGEPREIGVVAASFAERLDHLFKTVHPAGRREYSYREVAAAIEAAGGPSISAAYIHYLRVGKRRNPTVQHVEALATFFGVPVDYFYKTDLASRVDELLEIVHAVRAREFELMALRGFDHEDQFDEPTTQMMRVMWEEIRKRRPENRAGHGGGEGDA